MSNLNDRASMSYICPGCKANGIEDTGFAIKLAGLGIRDVLRVVQITCRKCGMSVFWNSELKQPNWVQVG